MFARWNRMAKQFSRIGKDITIAVKKGGSDPNANPALRRAIQNARAVNMPKDKVDSAIKRASGRDAANFEEVIYEGYAPHGVAVLVECATDNPTRTVAAIRNAFNKNGGNFATTGSVAFQFRRMGVFRLNPEGSKSSARAPAKRASRSSSPAACSRISARCRRRSRSAASRRFRPSTNTSAPPRPSSVKPKRPKCSN